MSAAIPTPLPPDLSLKRRPADDPYRGNDLKRGKWINGRWFPRWRLEEIREKYRDLPDDQIEPQQ